MVQPVDAAMAEERPEKQTIRALWVECVDEIVEADGREPVYLTLCGEQGLDVEALVEQGLLRRHPSSLAIFEEDAHKVVAVEARPDAQLKIRRRFPGLKLVPESFANLVRSENMTSYPTGDHWRWCRARVVNLDLNSPLQIESREHQLVFPQLAWVEKLARIHAQPSHLDWTLCLTLAAQIEWEAEIEHHVKTFLAENLGAEGRFRETAERLLGSKFLAGIEPSAAGLELSSLEAFDQQRLLMALVPKKVAHVCATLGWRIETRRNLCYGGSAERAAMATWILKFRWDQRASTEPTALYRESAAAAIESPGFLSEEGEIQPLSGR